MSVNVTPPVISDEIKLPVLSEETFTLYTHY